MQNVETCPQEEALKAVLLNLGYKEEELQDLHAVKGVTWRLFLQSGEPFGCFCEWGGVPTLEVLERYDRNRQFKIQQDCMSQIFFTL